MVRTNQNMFLFCLYQSPLSPTPKRVCTVDLSFPKSPVIFVWRLVFFVNENDSEMEHELSYKKKTNVPMGVLK